MQASLPKTSFDVVTLIGVLGSARVYDTMSEDPVQALLEKAYSMLSPGGVLFLAFENQLGLKYLAGAPEDNYNIPMYGINDCYAEDGIVTFGRSESLARLRRAGFVDVAEFLPFPDYKLPLLVVHPAAKEMAVEAFNVGTLVSEYIQRGHAPYTFSLEKAWNVVCRNGLLWDLSNSFCFVATKQPLVQPEPCASATKNMLVSHYSTSRKLCFAKQTSFIKEGDAIYVHRRALSGEQPSAQPGEIKNSYPEKEQYHTYSKSSDGLFFIVNKKGWSAQDIAAWNKPLLKYWSKRTFLQHGTALLPGSMMDCIARNILVDKSGGVTLIDQEWQNETGNHPLSFLVAYNLLVTLSDVSDVEAPDAKTPLGIWMLTLKVIQELHLKFPEQDQQAFFLWLDAFHEIATGNKSASDVYKTKMLTVRHSQRELSAYVHAQDRRIAALNAKLSAMEQERNALQAILDKFTQRKE